MSDPVRILLPVARCISGSVYRPRDKDSDGKPLVYKSGPNIGQPRVDFNIGLAIPKTPGHTHWAQSEWGTVVWRAGQAFFPQAHASTDFSWKIDDGDSAAPNKKGNKMCDREGAPGHWILWLGGARAPALYVSPSQGVYQPVPAGVEVPEGERITKTGDWLQAQITVTSNNSTQSPGVYLNHGMTLFVRSDTEIKTGPDAAAVFGAAPVAAAMPAGVAPVPFAAPPTPFQAPGAPFAPAPVAVAPHPAILAPVAPPLPPAVPAAPAVPQMTAAANGATYQQYRDAGWTDAQMRANGLLV